jgi:hypothetical protein
VTARLARAIDLQSVDVAGNCVAAQKTRDLIDLGTRHATPRTEKLDLVLPLHIPRRVLQLLAAALDVFADAGYRVACTERENGKNGCCEFESCAHWCPPVEAARSSCRKAISNQRAYLSRPMSKSTGRFNGVHGPDFARQPNN